MTDIKQKIMLLAKQAGINFTPAQFSGVLEDEIDEFQLMEFAKLVASDCAMIAYNSGVNDSDCCANSILYEYADCRSDK